MPRKQDERLGSVEVLSNFRKVAGHLIESASIGVKPTVGQVADAVGIEGDDVVLILDSFGVFAKFFEFDFVSEYDDEAEESAKNKALLNYL